jgi:hypothetical protein
MRYRSGDTNRRSSTGWCPTRYIGSRPGCKTHFCKTYEIGAWHSLSGVTTEKVQYCFRITTTPESAACLYTQNPCEGQRWMSSQPCLFLIPCNGYYLTESVDDIITALEHSDCLSNQPQGRPKFLYAAHLVALNAPHSGYISPEAMPFNVDQPRIKFS